MTLHENVSGKRSAEKTGIDIWCNGVVTRSAIVRVQAQSSRAKNARDMCIDPVSFPPLRSAIKLSFINIACCIISSFDGITEGKRNFEAFTHRNTRGVISSLTRASRVFSLGTSVIFSSHFLYLYNKKIRGMKKKKTI